MRQKTLVYVSICFALTMCLFGCSTMQTDRVPQGQTESQTQARQPQVITPVAPLNCILGFVPSPQGVYLLQQVSPSSVNLLYIDAKTKQEVYLCSVPNCSHNTETCTSYISLHDGEYEPQLFFHDGFIYLTRGAVNQAYPPSITRINRDGSGRQIISELETGESFRGAVFGYGDSVLIEIAGVNPEGVSATYLEKIDLESGAREKLIAYTGAKQHDYFVMGMADTRLIFIDISEAGFQYFWVDPSGENLSLETCSEQNALTERHDQKNVFYTIQKNYLCKYDRLNKQLSYQDLTTNEKTIFDVPVLEEGDILYGLEYMVDGTFALTLDDKDGTAISAPLDLNTGKLTGVRIEHTKKNPNEPIAIFEDELIYKMYDKEVLLKNQGEAGLVNEMCYFTVYGFVDKEKFLSGEKGTEIALPT